MSDVIAMIAMIDMIDIIDIVDNYTRQHPEVKDEGNKPKTPVIIVIYLLAMKFSEISAWLGTCCFAALLLCCFMAEIDCISRYSVFSLLYKLPFPYSATQETSSEKKKKKKNAHESFSTIARKKERKKKDEALVCTKADDDDDDNEDEENTSIFKNEI